MNCRLAKQTGQQRHEGNADQRHAAARHELLHALGLGTGVVVAVTLQQIDRTPNAEASAQRHNEGLKNTNSRIKESHK